VVFGGDGYIGDDVFRDVDLMFRGSVKDRERCLENKKFRRNVWLWLIDNAPRYYNGKNLYDFYQLLADSDLVNKPELLKFMKAGKFGRVNYPRLLKKMTEKRMRK